MSAFGLAVRAGAVERGATPVRVLLERDRAATLPGYRPGQTECHGVALRDQDGGGVLPAQYDPIAEELSFVLDGALAAGGERVFQALTKPDEVAAALGAAAFPASFTVKLDRVVLQVAGEAFATYIVSGTRRPYFWPVLGPAGASLVRGQGSGDHPHHTGMSLNYGGHSEAGSVNIWSDWDEPPYGPGGRMIHRGFRRLVAGPVYGELVQDLTYLDAEGEPFVTEARTVRWWWHNRQTRFLDFGSRVLEFHDRAPGPFLFMIRTPQSLGIPEHGMLTNSAAAPLTLPDGRRNYYHAGWIDASGPTGHPPPAPPDGPPEELADLRERAQMYTEVGTGPWNGIALFDHPANDGYPNLVGKYARPQQIVQAHYPPEDAAHGGFSFRYRVVVHDQDADAARISTLAEDYAEPIEVEII